MNYIYGNIKFIDENKIVEIIIYKYNNSYVIKYYCDDRIITRNYDLV